MSGAQANKPLNKSDFVRSFPDTVPATDIVKAAAEQGIVLSRLHVNNVRFAARKKAAKTSRIPVAPVPHAATDEHSVPASDGERALTEAIERIVEQKVEELFRRRVGELIA